MVSWRATVRVTWAASGADYVELTLSGTSDSRIATCFVDDTGDFEFPAAVVAEVTAASGVRVEQVNRIRGYDSAADTLFDLRATAAMQCYGDGSHL